MRNMEYREHEPPECLRRHVQCVWRVRDEAREPAIRTIYPDGRCEIIAHLAHPPRIWLADGGWRRQVRHAFVAQQRAAIRLAPEGGLHCIGVRLRPAASAALVERPDRWRDAVVDLASLDDGVFVTRFAAAASCFASEDAPLWQLFAEKLLPAAIDERIETAVARLEATNGGARIDETAARVGMGLRSFQTRFLECVGIGAKEFARLLRLQATIRGLDSGNEPISHLALDAGYSDQSHATREVTRITGLTPARLRAALRGDREGDDTVRLAAAFVRGRS
jgi:AraC-like DNA-binding protein